MLNETHHAPPRYKIPEFFSSLLDAKGNPVWRPSENVAFELGAAGYLYGNRIVIMKEEGVEFPSNFRELGYISFSKDELDAQAMGVLKELIGFGIVRIST
jgi:predicted nucleotide-binding protein